MEKIKTLPHFYNGERLPDSRIDELPKEISFYITEDSVFGYQFKGKLDKKNQAYDISLDRGKSDINSLTSINVMMVAECFITEVWTYTNT